MEPRHILQAENFTENKSFSTMQFSLIHAASWLLGLPYWLLPDSACLPSGEGGTLFSWQGHILNSEGSQFVLFSFLPCAVLAAPRVTYLYTSIFLAPRPSLSLWALLKTPREPTLCSGDRLSPLTLPVSPLS